MKFLSRLFKSQPASLSDTDQLRELLFAARKDDDAKRFTELCRTQQEAILSSFPDWQRVPEHLRSSPALVQEYGESLVTIANYFDKVLGRPELIATLRGDKDTNPVFKWEQGLRHAEQLEDELRYGDSTKELESLVEEINLSGGVAVDQYLALAYGHLGRTYLQSGNANKARDAAEIALRLCREQNDLEGVPIYLRGLYEIHRYLGEGAAAARYAEQYADLLASEGDGKEVGEWRKRAEFARTGEPLNRVVVHIDDQQFELEETPPIPKDGTVQLQFHFHRNRISLHTSNVLTEQGKRLTAQAKYEEALEKLRAAATADAYDPDPHYHGGLALLHLKRYEEAVRSYEAAEQRAPGWFHCCALQWLARQLASGKIEHESFLALRVLEDDPEMGAEEKVCLAEQALGIAPGLASLHLHYGMNLQATGRREEALVAYRKGLGCAEDQQTRARLLVSLAMLDTNNHQKRLLLEEAVGSKSDLVARATAWHLLRDDPPLVQ